MTEKTLKYGKRVGNTIYFHVSMLDVFPLEHRKLVIKAQQIAQINQTEHYNVVKLFRDNLSKLSLLSYQNFFKAPFPELASSWSVNLEKNTVSHRRYDERENPPILHRKELLILKTHKKYREYESLTTALEMAGLFKTSKFIGFKKQWEKLLENSGYCIKDHILYKTRDCLNSNLINDTIVIDRHKTAISRYSLSTPMQALARHGYLDGNYSVFDYGCGKGDDVRILKANEININGWDPHFKPEAQIISSDIVNLGFVINVIELPKERDAALKKAYSLSLKFLVVTALLDFQHKLSTNISYGDGLITRKKTFQKTYTQVELKDYIESTLHETAIAAGPGVFLVFKDKLEEQSFLFDRQRSRGGIRSMLSHLLLQRATPEERKEAIYSRFRERLDDLWNCCINLGREPRYNEVGSDLFQELKSRFGSLKKVFAFLVDYHGNDALELVKQARYNDLLVYIALIIFSKRKPYNSLPTRLKNDIKSFFGSYKHALSISRELLFSVGDTSKIYDASLESFNRKIGYIDKNHSLQLHSSLIDRLPPILRCYIGCATQMYGDLESIDLVKIHLHSGKLTLMKYDDFDNVPIPMLSERIKIDMRRQVIDFFNYGDEFAPQPVYLKSQYLAEDQEGYNKQKAFDEMLVDLNLFEFDNYGPSREEFATTMSDNSLTIDDFSIKKNPPTSTIS